MLLFALLLFNVFQVQAANFDLTGSCPGGEGDVGALITAINTANANGEADTITLAEGCVYTLDAIDNVTDGANGLPSITSAIIMQASGTGATIQRDLMDPDEFRLFHVAITGTLTLNNLTVENGVSSEGGGIYNGRGRLILDAATVTNNTATSRGGGIAAYGAVSIINSTFSENTCAGDFGGGGVYAGGGMEFADGIINVSGSTFVDNSAYEGGGLASRMDAGFATLTVTDTTFSGNQATGEWGSGGGISSNGNLNIVGSTFVNNVSTGTGGNGGGGLIHINGTAVITNSTFSANSSATDGGGIYFRDMEMSLTHVTVAYNTADSDNDDSGDGGGIFIAGWGGIFTATNTLIAHNTDRSSQGPDCFTLDGGIAPFISQGYNLIQDVIGCTIAGDVATNITGSDPLLGPLQDNGGGTQTHALLEGSPAQDRIPNGGNGCGMTITDDQRGFAHPYHMGGACDSGAYEVHERYVRYVDEDAPGPTHDGRSWTTAYLTV